MRSRLTVIILLLCNLAYAQKRLPDAFANTYPLSDADGFPGDNYTILQYHPSGKIYAKDFFGTFHVTGNNYLKYIPELNNISNSAVFKLRPDNEVWIYEPSSKIYILRSDSLWKIIAPVNNQQRGIFYNDNTNRLYSFQRIDSSLIISEFKNYAWSFSGKYKLPDNLEIKNMAVVFNEDKTYIIFLQTNITFKIFELDTVSNQLIYQKTLSDAELSIFYATLSNNQLQKKDAFLKPFSKFLNARTGKNLALTSENFFNFFITIPADSSYIYKYGENIYERLSVSGNFIDPNITVFESKDKINSTIFNPAYPYFLGLTGNKPFRVFPYIKKYPHIYNNDNATNIFALAQDEMGRIWAGNYLGQLSIIEPKNNNLKVKPLPPQPYPFMNAGINYKNKMYLVGETNNGGVLQYDSNGKMKKVPSISPTGTGFFLYLSKKSNTLYFTSVINNYSVLYCDAAELEKPKVNWRKLDSTSGIASFGLASITEDTLGRLWLGHPTKGFAVYDPSLKKGQSFHTNNNESPIGFVSSTTDKYGTVWMGSNEQGLWYYNDYSKPATPENIHQCAHPLFNNVKRINSMTIYKSWLVLGCYNRICLLNLDSFYLKNKIIVRYLNHQEANLTSFLEQNTMLVSKTDSTLWFSTSDMLYQWDIKTWLQMPNYKAQMTAFAQHDSTRTLMSTDQKIKFKAGNNSFDIIFEYLSPDGLPRFTRTALVKDRDSISYNKVGTKSKFTYQNLSAGSYTFYIQVFEQDGTTSTYKYQFSINKYLWQHWWFWTLITLLFTIPIIFLLNARRKKAIQDKLISQLNIVTLSSQFRPHFILNTLNAIGADLKDKPAAEHIISRLGESISLIFKYVQQKKVYHSLKDEWTLVNNAIQIHRIIYIPDLQVEFVGEDLLAKYEEIKLPLGILEVNVENALLHGLRNKKTPPYQLKLQLQEEEDNLFFIIKDNGIGREAAMKISNHKKNGTGIKNLQNIISILNHYNMNKIEMNYLDSNQDGTEVKIKVPKNYHYEY